MFQWLSRWFGYNSYIPLEKESNPNYTRSEIDIPIPNDGYRSGTLFTPKQSTFGLVLILPGSGPVTRQGNVTGMKMNIYSRLQNSITNFAVFYNDKRGVGSSTGDFYTTGFHDNVNDGVQVLTYLIANVNGIDPSKIYLIGHSEGGWTISAMYPLLIKNNIKPKGMMFLCGFGTSMNESLRYQVEQGIISVQKMTGIKGWLYRLLGVDQMIKSQFEANMKYVLSTTSDIVRIMFFYKLNAKWYREIIQYDTIPDWEQIDCDVLAIAGVKDVQVPILNIETIKNLVPNAASVTAMNIENMNHILKTQEGEPSIMNVMTDYKNVVEKELAPELIHSIQNFLKNE